MSSLVLNNTEEINMRKEHMCPKCSGKKFSATAHVCQDWMVDKYGAFIETIENCSQVIHRPNDDDVWACLDCGYDAAGGEFVKM